MKREVELLRELLGLLKEIEHAILEGLEEHIQELSDQRSSLSKKLKNLQRQRTLATKICFSNEPSKLKEKHLTSELFTETMSKNDELGTQILTLRDQILVLIKKITLQKAQIESVVKQSSFELSQDIELLPIEKSEKTTLKTIDPEDAVEI